MPAVDLTDYVACESIAAIVQHARKLEPPFAAIQLGGHWPRPQSVCGREVAWDTKLPVELVECRDCRKVLDLGEYPKDLRR